MEDDSEVVVGNLRTRDGRDVVVLVFYRCQIVVAGLTLDQRPGVVLVGRCACAVVERGVGRCCPLASRFTLR